MKVKCVPIDRAVGYCVTFENLTCADAIRAWCADRQLWYDLDTADTPGVLLLKDETATIKFALEWSDRLSQ